MSRAILATFIIGLVCLPAAVNAQEGGAMFFGGFLDGNEYRNRTDLEKHSYLMGFHDGLMAAPLFGLERTGDAMSETWYERCEAVGNSGQLQAIIDRYVDEHPENWHHPMPSIFHMAVKDICDFEYVSGRDERPLPSTPCIGVVR